jgi:NAD(P)-dependent dehydrogenase (short-subunit alcohol dehydrogenase family)
MSGTMVVVGASRGIGAAAAAHLTPRGGRLIAVSRTPAAAGDWVAADVATDAGVARVAEAVGDGALDALLFLGGTWERGAFTDAYRFSASPAAEIRQVIEVNLVAPILLAQALAPALAKATTPRIVLMGALYAHSPIGPEVANAASKFGLEGAALALGAALRPQGIGVTLINPGNVATAEVEADVAEGRFAPQAPIPMADLLAAIDFALAVSADAVPRRIDLAQTRPA